MIQIRRKSSLTFQQPLELLSDCHRRVESFLHALIPVAEQVSGSELNSEQRRALEAALRYFREAAQKHTADEEESLFPRMRTRRRDSIVGAMTFGLVQRVLAMSLMMFAHALGAASTNLASVEVHETLQGHFVYVKNCVFCHGKRGDGKGEMGVTVQPLPRDFGAGVFKYRSTPSGSLPTNDDLARTVREGIPDTAMPAFATLPQRDLQAVIEYVKTFSPKWRKPQHYAAPIAVPKRPDWFDDTKEFGRRVEKGRVLYVISCAPCHGAKADGIGSTTNLVDSWGNPTPARDLRLPYIRSGRQIEDIYKVLVTGLDGTPMPSFAESTTEEQRWELVAFIEQLRRDNRRH